MMEKHPKMEWKRTKPLALLVLGLAAIFELGRVAAVHSLWIGAGGAVLCALVIAWFFRRCFGLQKCKETEAQHRPMVSDETDESRMINLKQQAEYIVLQSQINPHFLYNTLDSIRGQVMAEGLHETANMLEALSNLFRYSISKKNVIITLEEELENVDDYMRIINYRFANRFRLIKKIDTQDNSLMSFILPKLTFQPLVENAIQHGMEKKKGTGTIIIRASRSDRYAYFSVEDDGLGMDMETLDGINTRLRDTTAVENRTTSSQHSGIALTNVASRLKILYGEEASVSVSSTPGHGTEISMSVPMQKVMDSE